MTSIIIRQMAVSDMEPIHRVFAEYGIHKPLDYLHACWGQNVKGERISLNAYYEGRFAGSLHVLKTSFYPYFAERDIPEINDFNVIPPLRRLGIGSALLDAAERLALEERGVVGIGVGMYASYGSAQRLYVRRGYIPDGRGLIYNEQPVVPGAEVCVDDNLVLYFTKERGQGAAL